MTLATASPAGVPHASTFLYVNDGPTLYFWSRPDTTTARHVEQNPVVSFAIDQYTEDLRETKGVQGAGECSVILSGEEIARVADLFGQRFPDLSPGNTMSISFFRIAPTDLQFIDNSQSGGRGPRGRVRRGVPQGALLQRLQRPPGATWPTACRSTSRRRKPTRAR